MRSDRWIATPPERVFEVLSDPARFQDWVVGTKEIRGSEGGWPAPGARFHHTVGKWFLTIKDTTEVELADPPRRLVLLARAGLLGTARVDLRLRPDGRGTLVSMDETPTHPSPLKLPPLSWLVVTRNKESLARLKRLAEADEAPARA